MGMRRQWLVLALSICIVASASAQPSRGPEAEALFLDGKRAMSERSYDVACAKFAASQALEPRASTLMNLGACHEAAGRIVSAWYAFADAAKLAGASIDPRENGLADSSREKAKALAMRRSSLTVVVPAAARVDGFTVARNGEPIVEAQWNGPIYLDGGEYTIVARATGTEAWTSKVAIASELDDKRLEIPVLHAAAAAPAGDPSGDADPQADEAGQPLPTIFTLRRKVAVGVAIAGLSAVAAGVYFGLDASSLQDESDALCPETMCGNTEGLRLNDEARSSATKANVLWIVGGLAVAGGATLWFLSAPHAVDGDVAVIPTFGPGMGGLAAHGSF